MVLITFSTYKRVSILGFLFLLFLLSLATPGLARKSKSTFPLYYVIQDNVIFWENIYSKYTINTAVVHDKNDLSVVYTVLTLYDKNLPGSRKLNTPLLNLTKKKYTRILKRLASGLPATTSDERRVASLFKGKSSRQRMAKAAKNIRVQMGLKERFLEGVTKSGAYMTKIKNIFRSYNLPADLAYLPHVESSFNIKAYSKFGAAGIWQFTKTTGREYMTVNYAIDERRDPIIATHAAAKFLKKNHRSLGNWPLAITAYNYGPSGMQRAVKAKGTYGNIFKSYQQGYFKFAARNFYSEFLAARNVAKRLEKNPRTRLESIQLTHSFKLHGYAHISDICQHFNISPAALANLNPSLQSPILKGEKYIPKGFRLHLPDGHKTQHLLAILPNSLYKKNQKRSKFYRVKRGDTTGKIARQHKISLKKLRRANNLKTNSTIYVGQKLRIPAATSLLAATHRIVSPSSLKKKHTLAKHTPSVLAKITELRDTKKTRPSAKSVTNNTKLSLNSLKVRSYKQTNGIYYGKITSHAEESLGMYAKWSKTSQKSLSKLNNFKAGTRIQPGQPIHLRFDKVSRAFFENQRFTHHLEREKDFFSSFQITGMKDYTVSPGDTLWELCYTKFQLPYWLLQKYNSNIKFDKLVANQTLTVPIVEAL